MGFLSGNTNSVVVSQCNNLQDLTVTLTVTEDLVTVGNAGFSLQLNCFPTAGQIFQNQTLNWFQYTLVVQNGQIGWNVEYWDTNNFRQSAPTQSTPWPANYTPNPANTTPALPVIANDSGYTTITNVASNQILAGSVLQVKMTTDTSGNITRVDYSYTDPSGGSHTAHYTFASYALFSIYGVEAVVVGPIGGAPTSFVSGGGTLTYNVSSGSLGVESSTTCGGYPEPGTAEDSNSIYGDVTGSGLTVTQSVSVVPMTMSFDFVQSTFGLDEVEGTPSWNPAYYLQVTGFPNKALGFSASSDLNSTAVSPQPTITVEIDQSLNPNLTSAQIATIRNNLPIVDTFGPPVQAIDTTLSTNYQTFLYPYNISFPNLDAFSALSGDTVAFLTLTAALTVPVPSGGNDNTQATDTNVTVNCSAAIELSAGEDPRMVDLNPTSPLSYPSWMSYDLRIFTVTAGQKHDVFSVPTLTDSSQAVPYIRHGLKNLNNPTLILNGDSFDTTLTQNEDTAAVPWLPSSGNDPAQFSFAVARVRIKSSITETIGPVRVFFRLFNAASTVSNFAEVGTAAGTYRWGSDGTPGHKIPLLGVESALFIFNEYVTVPCFATDRVNLNSPADMNTQHDPPNALQITTSANEEVDTYFGCWLDVNQTTPFLIPTPPILPSEWDGPWTGTESLNGAIVFAPHQCLVAEIRYDGTPIPPGADTGDSDKLAQRNIAWLGVQP
jgi:hypothetical protein